jgi:hypothetical protein
LTWNGYPMRLENINNPTAHSPRISWPMTEQDALDLLTLLSMLHRRLDQAVDVPASA